MLTASNIIFEKKIHIFKFHEISVMKPTNHNIMKIAVFSFLRSPGSRQFQITYDEGQGLKLFEAEVNDSLFPVMVDSPISFINSYINSQGAKLIQVVEEDGYDHFRMYLEIPEDAAGLETPIYSV